MGALGVSVDFETALGLAADLGYDGIDPDLGYVREHGPAKVRAEVESRGLRWGVAGAPAGLTAPPTDFARALADLPAYVDAMVEAGIERCNTWLRPVHDELTYRRNFTMHAERIAIVAGVLAEAGIRLGLEYVGPKTSWIRGRFPFVHSLAETRELIAASGATNVGIFLDTYHWYCAGENADDLRALSASDVVGADVNDAPVGIPVEEQQDLSRELPCATGVIDVAGFVGALHEIGYDGPVKVEPFNKTVAAMKPADAAKAGLESLRKALAS